MKYREGEVRIPSGCAISAAISREGRPINGESMIRSMVPMHDRSNGLGGGLRLTEYIPSIRTSSRCTFFSAAGRAGMSVRRILKKRLR